MTASFLTNQPVSTVADLRGRRRIRKEKTVHALLSSQVWCRS